MSDDPRIRRAFLEEQKRRAQLAGTNIDLSLNSFPAQASFINDPAKRKAALCTRRAGKTWGTAIMLVQAALANAHSTSIFLSYTRQSAQNTIQKPIADLLRRSRLEFEFAISTLTFTLGNGSKIVLRGADKPDQVDKLRGQAYPLVVVDECGHGNYATTLTYFVNEVLEPCVAQYDGTIVLLGTPSPYTETLFYNATSPNPTETGWSVHRWSWNQNPAVESAISKTLAARLKRDPDYETTDGYKREWQGDWAIDESELVYRFNPAKNLIPALPTGTYRHVLGVDLGSKDATAFVIAAFSHSDPTLYLVHSEKHQHLDFTSVALKSKELINKYHPIACVIDGANLQGVEEIRNRHHIPFQSTPKSPNYKFTAIQLMNGDFGSSRIKILAHQNQQLIAEYKTLTWDEKQPTKENQAQKNDLADAALYAYLKSRFWLGKVNEAISEDPTDAPQRYFPLIPNNDEDDQNVFDYLDIYTELTQ